MLTWGAHGAAGLLVRDRDRVLMQLRSPWVQHGGTWSIPGGALLPGESAADAALRETQEETGLQRAHLRVSDLRHVAEPVPGWTYTTVVARLRKSARDLGTPAPSGEATLQEWVPVEDVAERNLHPGFAASWPEVRPLLRGPLHEPVRDPVRVLFVCVGNVCRSPLAEVLLRRMADERGIALEASSAGTLAEVGRGMDDGTAACAQRHGLDGTAHVARQTTDALIRSAEVVVALDLYASAVIYGMLAWVSNPPTVIVRPVLNPWHMEAAFHETAYEQVAAVCDEIITWAGER